MDFLTLSKERFSCRKFKADKVEQEKIEKIITACSLAPTAVNRQPQKILILTDEDKLKALKECTKFDFDAPLCFVICYNESNAWSRKRFDNKNAAEIDASIAATHMMLEAQDLGLGTTWVMVFDPVRTKEVFSIPDDYEILALMPTGYPADDVEINPMHFQSKGLEDLAGYNEF